MEFYSHPEKLLKLHLKEVFNRAQNYLKIHVENDLSEILKYICLTHDFGKYTTYFQSKILGVKTNEPLSDHSLLSSIFCYYLISKSIDFTKFKEKLKEFIPLISFFVVIHHHRDLTSLDKLRDILENEENIIKIKKQMEDILTNKNQIEGELKEIGINDPNLDKFYNSIDELVEDIKKYIFCFDLLKDEELKIEIAFITLSLFSALIDADKKSASNLIDLDRVSIPSDIIDRYKEIKFKDADKNLINLIREEIYKNVVEKVENLNLNDKIYTLTSPTGSGKTLTSLSFAFKLKERIKNELNYIPRIIYSLPFISIIDQNFKEIEKFLNLIDDFRINKSKYLISHHHLSSTKYEVEEEDYDIEKSIQFIESWDSEIIVTTFVQLLETIIGFKNRFLKKYHNLANSIILLDEVQNIPVEYWDLIEKIFYYMTKYLNTYIILLTATKPLIFRNLIKPVELLPNYENYYSKFERVTIKPKLTIQTLDDLLILVDEINKKYNSIMITLNTINSSIEFYKKLKEKVKDKDIFYLSANIIPKQRLKRIEEIKDLLKKNKGIILVSTQVIEAGVDIDFECVIRDIGPFDSIMQICGRCNREFKRKEGDVFIVYLHDGKKYYSHMVYSKLSPNISFQLLKDLNIIEEKEFLSLIDLYFKKIVEIKSHEKSQELYKAFLNLSFYDELKEWTISNFKLIDDLNTIPVFIELDDFAKEIFDRFRRIVEDSNLKPWEKKLKILEFRNDFNSYVINVRLNNVNFKTLEILYENNLGYVRKEDLEKFYDLETGFKKQGGFEYLI